MCGSGSVQGETPFVFMHPACKQGVDQGDFLLEEGMDRRQQLIGVI